jgi:hypothetical protein
MTSAGSTIRGMATELQVISHDDPVLELIKFASVLVCSSTTFIIEPANPPENGTITPSPTGTRKAAKPPLVCGLVATKRPNRVGERAGNAQETGGRAATEPQTRCWRGPKEADHGATEPRLCSPVPLGWGVLTHQAALNNSKTKKSGRRTWGLGFARRGLRPAAAKAHVASCLGWLWLWFGEGPGTGTRGDAPDATIGNWQGVNRKKRT